jgi:hypothetical protein
MEFCAKRERTGVCYSVTDCMAHSSMLYHILLLAFVNTHKL